MNVAEELLTNSTLIDLIQGLVDLPDDLSFDLNVDVTGVKMDSRLLQKGDLFMACFGSNHDAREYIPQAVELGVAAVLAESGGGWQGIQFVKGVAVIAVDNLSAKISEIAGRFYQHPSEKQAVIGITGTNGKTSCSQFVASMLAGLGQVCGTIGTLGFGLPGQLHETELTTPDAVQTQKALAEMHHDGAATVAMEVSSVGLHQSRVGGVQFDTAVFTNLTRDHLDYHGSMTAYAETKRKLFTVDGLKTAVINLDDTYALSILNAISPDVEILTYSVYNSVASIYAEQLHMTPSGFDAVIHTPWGDGALRSSLLGKFNFSNLLAAIATVMNQLDRSGEVNVQQVLSLVSQVAAVDGRMEIIGEGHDVTAVVDYAHTPDGLKSALQALRQHFSGDIHCVFGCGGNRDRGKRPMMGEIAQTYADHLIITDDNPRNEEGDDIIQHILSGISDTSGTRVVRDRAKAIVQAIAQAGPGDVILIAGKGHETYQDVGGTKMLFSDASQVRLALQERIRT